MKSVARFLIMSTVSLTAGVAWSQDAGWPRVVKDGQTEVVVFQPQPDSLDGVTLHSRVAVSIKRPQDKAPLFGALWLVATLTLIEIRIWLASRLLRLTAPALRTYLIRTFNHWSNS